MTEPATIERLDHDERNDAPLPVALIGLDTITLRPPPMHDATRPTFAIHTLGCKLNSADAQSISFALQEYGFAEVPFDARRRSLYRQYLHRHAYRG